MILYLTERNASLEGETISHLNSRKLKENQTTKLAKIENNECKIDSAFWRISEYQGNKCTEEQNMCLTEPNSTIPRKAEKSELLSNSLSNSKFRNELTKSICHEQKTSLNWKCLFMRVSNVVILSGCGIELGTPVTLAWSSTLELKNEPA